MSLRSRLKEEVLEMRARDQAEREPCEAVPSPPVEQARQTPNLEALRPPEVKKRAKPKRPPPGKVEIEDLLPDELELARQGPSTRRSTKPGRGNYRKVQLGLTLNLLAAAVLLGTFIIALIGVLCSVGAIYAAMDADNNPTKAPKPSEGLPVLAICLAGLWVISEGIHVAGLGYCLGAPRKDAAQGLALTALVAAAAGLPLACTGGVLALTGSGGAAGLVLLIVGLVLVCGAKVLYLVFLRALGLAMEVLAVARQVYLIIGLVLLAAAFHLTVLAAAGFGLTTDLGGVVTGKGSGEGLRDVSGTAVCCWGASLLILLYALIRYVLTIYETRGEVIYRLARQQVSS